jgi:hypothetical protein
MTRLPVLLARLAAAILPGASRDWGQAMIAETRSIARSDAAFRFALGCLRVAVGLRLSSLFMRQEPRMTLHPIVHPRRFAALCAVAAVGLGMSFMGIGGAPAAYFAN